MTERPRRRRHSFPDDAPPRPLLRHRIHRDWRRHHRRLLYTPIVACVQFIAALFLVLLLTGFWAYLFMAPPEAAPITEQRPERGVALALWSELTHSLLDSIAYKFKTPSEVKETLNLADYSRSNFAFFPRLFDFLPDGRYDPWLVRASTIIAKEFDAERDVLFATGDLVFPFVQVRGTLKTALTSGAPLPLSIERGIAVNMTFQMKFPPDPHQSKWRLQSVHCNSPSIESAIHYALCVLSRDYKPLVPPVGPAELALLRTERHLSGLEGYRGRRAIVTKRAAELRPAPPPIVLADFRRPISVPRKIAVMPAPEQARALRCFSIALQHLLFTFALDQARLRAVLDRITGAMRGPVRVRILEFDLGVRTWRDLPAFRMLRAPPEPYSYRLGFRGTYPGFRLRLAVDGLAASSSIALEIGNVTLSGIVNVGVVHPLAFDLSKCWPVDYLVLSLSGNPVTDFDVRVDHAESHFLGMRLNRALHDLFEVQLAKSFVRRFVAFFLDATVVWPNRVRIPWLVDPTALLFSSNSVQRAYEWIRNIFFSIRS